MLNLFAIASLAIFSSTNQLSETATHWHLGNRDLKVSVAKATCTLTQIILNGNSVISSPCSIAVYNGEQDHVGAVINKYSAAVAFPRKGLYVRKEYSGQWVEQLFEVTNKRLYWEVVCKAKAARDQEVRIDFVIPLAKKIDHIFTAAEDMPTTVKNATAGRIIYRRDTFLPIITLYDPTRDLGISFIAPFEIAKPNLTFSIEQEKLIISYYHLKSTNTRNAKVALMLVPHEGDWRPGLAFLTDEYPEYFYPAVESNVINEGLFYLSFPFKKETNIKEMRNRNVKWVELTGYFPFYGLYVPKAAEWGIILDSDDVTLSHWERGAGEKRNSHEQLKSIIDLWQRYGIHVYQYFQSFEAWHQFAQKYYASDIARDASGQPIRAWPYTNLMNPDPQNEWGKYIIDQAEAILKKYHQIDGIFYDRMDYKDFDFAHSDGITMLNNKPAYMLGFAQERINEILFDLVHKNNKGIWGNGPTSIEVCKNLDGIMAERKLDYLYKIQYLGCARPIIFLPYDSSPRDTEDKLKHSLLCGAFPSTTYGGDECKYLEEKHAPLFELIRAKKWVLTANPLDTIPGNRRNIFRTPDGDYVVVVVNLNKSQLMPHPFEYKLLITVNVPDAYSINYAHILSGDLQGVNLVNFSRTGSKISIVLPQHLSSSVLYLTKTKKFDVLRLSSPILLKGRNERLIFGLSEVSEGKPSVLEITMPWDRQSRKVESSEVEFQTFVPPDVNGEVNIRLRYKGRDYIFSSWVLDEISLAPVEEIFVHLKDGENIPFYCVNNSDKNVTIDLSGSSITHRGRVETPKKITLGPFEHKNISVFVKTDINDRLKLTVHLRDKEISNYYDVETGLAFSASNLFHDDFRQGMNKWKLKSGEWTVENGTARGCGQSHWAIVHNAEWSDYTYEVSTRCKGSDDPRIDWLKSYIFFRIKDDNNFYRFGIHGDADVVDLYARVNGKWKKISSAPFKPQKDKWYTLRIQAEGTAIRGYIDGTKILDVNDKTFRNGGIGIGVLEDAMICEYRDVTVKK
jgi:hypothetical protein